MVEYYVGGHDGSVCFKEISKGGINDQIREERAADRLYILCLCVVERNFLFSWGLRLEAADGLQIWREKSGKGPGKRGGGPSSRWMKG